MSRASEEISEAPAKGRTREVHEPLPDGDFSSLGEMPHYEAISYVQGSSRRDREMTNAGQVIDITANMQRVLRRVGLSEEPRTLRADSICFKKGDIAERGKQLQLMGEIFGRASRGLMYVGLDDSGHGEAVASPVSRARRYGLERNRARRPLLGRLSPSWIPRSAAGFSPMKDGHLSWP